jgi:radical SAM family uncharacterized protein
MNNMMLEELLLGVRKPARYIGEEWNVSRKDFDQAAIKFALCFPDLYEVGMSNLGIRILYGILNDIKDVACERFFACDTDMEEELRSKHAQIFSLESKKKLREFDILGFSLGSELLYTNVLNILDLGNIPLRAAERDERFPLVAGGGPCVLNPEPMHAFFDLFVIGEAEDLTSEFIDTYRKFKDEYRSAKISKQKLLLEFSRIPGVYVPSLKKDSSFRIQKRIISDLNSSYFPANWLVPYIQIVHDRITLEVMRGCPNKCRFCQARSQYFPFRQRDKTNILNLATDAYRRTGYEEISLGGLSVSDYPKAEELLSSLIDLFKTKAVSLSLPSIKSKALVGNLSAIIAKVKKTGLTFAPEAASGRLRNVLGKDFDEQEFFTALEEAYRSGYQRVKLYFMIGIPYEEQKDLDGIIDFSMRVSELRRKAGKAPAQINISVNTLIPKPHTPLQWFAMENLENIKDKQDYLKSKAGKQRRLELNFHDRHMSFLEGVLSRGDRMLSEVIYSAFKAGARFDAWSNYFSFEKWLDAFKALDIDPQAYLKEKSIEEPLPWDFVDVGINKESLIAEFNKTVDIK